MDKEKALLEARATLSQFFQLVAAYPSRIGQDWREFLHMDVPCPVELADALSRGMESIDCAIREEIEGRTLSARLKQLLHTAQQTLTEAGWALEALEKALEELPPSEEASNDNSTPTA